MHMMTEIGNKGGTKEGKSREGEEQEGMKRVIIRLVLVQKVGVHSYWFRLTLLAITIIQTRNTVPTIQKAKSVCQH